MKTDDPNTPSVQKKQNEKLALKNAFHRAVQKACPVRDK